MKLSLLPAVAAAVALVQVGAQPLRVIVVSSSPDIAPSNLRFGHAVGMHEASKPGTLAHIQMMQHPDRHPQKGKGRGGCRGGRFRQKAVEISNAFRQALGMELIQTHRPNHGDHPENGMYHIMPFVGTPPTFIETMPAVEAPPSHYVHPSAPRVHMHHQGHRLHHMMGEEDSFMRRLNGALMSLGPWEGRAMAFVLGCGIGVLLRMFWVLAIVSYRAVRGEREDEHEYTHLIVEHFDDAEQIFVAPPMYTFPDEKAEHITVDAAPVRVHADEENSK